MGSETKLDVSEVKKLTIAVSEAATALDAILADGKLGFSDLVAIPGLVRTFKEFATVDFEQLIDQVAQLDEAEKNDVVETFKTHLNLHSETTESIIEVGFGILMEAVDAIQSLRDVVSRIRTKI